jgi:hypothetical protein
LLKGIFNGGPTAGYQAGRGVILPRKVT